MKLTFKNPKENTHWATTGRLYSCEGGDCQLTLELTQEVYRSQQQNSGLWVFDTGSPPRVDTLYFTQLCNSKGCSQPSLPVAIPEPSSTVLLLGGILVLLVLKQLKPHPRLGR